MSVLGRGVLTTCLQIRTAGLPAKPVGPSPCTKSRDKRSALVGAPCHQQNNTSQPNEVHIRFVIPY